MANEKVRQAAKGIVNGKLIPVDQPEALSLLKLLPDKRTENVSKFEKNVYQKTKMDIKSKFCVNGNTQTLVQSSAQRHMPSDNHGRNDKKVSTCHNWRKISEKTSSAECSGNIDDLIEKLREKRIHGNKVSDRDRRLRRSISLVKKAKNDFCYNRERYSKLQYFKIPKVSSNKKITKDTISENIVPELNTNSTLQLAIYSAGKEQNTNYSEANVRYKGGRETYVVKENVTADDTRISSVDAVVHGLRIDVKEGIHFSNGNANGLVPINNAAESNCDTNMTKENLNQDTYILEANLDPLQQRLLNCVNNSQKPVSGRYSRCPERDFRRHSNDHKSDRSTPNFRQPNRHPPTLSRTYHDRSRSPPAGHGRQSELSRSLHLRSRYEDTGTRSRHHQWNNNPYYEGRYFEENKYNFSHQPQGEVHKRLNCKKNLSEMKRSHTPKPHGTERPSSTENKRMTRSLERCRKLSLSVETKHGDNNCPSEKKSRTSKDHCTERSSSTENKKKTVSLEQWRKRSQSYETIHRCNNNKFEKKLSQIPKPPSTERSSSTENKKMTHSVEQCKKQSLSNETKQGLQSGGKTPNRSHRVEKPSMDQYQKLLSKNVEHKIHQDSGDSRHKSSVFSKGNTGISVQKVVKASGNINSHGNELANIEQDRISEEASSVTQKSSKCTVLNRDNAKVPTFQCEQATTSCFGVAASVLTADAYSSPTPAQKKILPLLSPSVQPADSDGSPTPGHEEMPALQSFSVQPADMDGSSTPTHEEMPIDTDRSPMPTHEEMPALGSCSVQPADTDGSPKPAHEEMPTVLDASPTPAHEEMPTDLDGSPMPAHKEMSADSEPAHKEMPDDSDGSPTPSHKEMPALRSSSRLPQNETRPPLPTDAVESEQPSDNRELIDVLSVPHEYSEELLNKPCTEPKGKVIVAAQCCDTENVCDATLNQTKTVPENETYTNVQAISNIMVLEKSKGNNTENKPCVETKRSDISMKAELNSEMHSSMMKTQNLKTNKNPLEKIESNNLNSLQSQVQHERKLSLRERTNELNKRKLPIKKRGKIIKISSPNRTSCLDVDSILQQAELAELTAKRDEIIRQIQNENLQSLIASSNENASFVQPVAAPLDVRDPRLCQVPSTSVNADIFNPDFANELSYGFLSEGVDARMENVMTVLQNLRGRHGHHKSSNESCQQHSPQFRVPSFQIPVSPTKSIPCNSAIKQSLPVANRLDDTIDMLARIHNENLPDVSLVASEASLLHYLQKNNDVATPSSKEKQIVTFQNVLNRTSSNSGLGDVSPDKEPAFKSNCVDAKKQMPNNAFEVHAAIDDAPNPFQRLIKRVRPITVSSDSNLPLPTNIAKQQVVELVPIKHYSIRPKPSLPTSSLQVIDTEEFSFNGTPRKSKTSLHPRSPEADKKTVGDAVLDEESDIDNSDSSRTIESDSVGSFEDSFISKSPEELAESEAENSVSQILRNIRVNHSMFHCLGLSLSSDDTNHQMCNKAGKTVLKKRFKHSNSTKNITVQDSPAKNTRSKSPNKMRFTRNSTKTCAIANLPSPTVTRKCATRRTSQSPIKDVKSHNRSLSEDVIKVDKTVPSFPQNAHEKKDELSVLNLHTASPTDRTLQINMVSSSRSCDKAAESSDSTTGSSVTTSSSSSSSGSSSTSSNTISSSENPVSSVIVTSFSGQPAESSVAVTTSVGEKNNELVNEPSTQKAPGTEAFFPETSLSSDSSNAATEARTEKCNPTNTQPHPDKNFEINSNEISSVPLSDEKNNARIRAKIRELFSGTDSSDECDVTEPAQSVINPVIVTNASSSLPYEESVLSISVAATTINNSNTPATIIPDLNTVVQNLHQESNRILKTKSENTPVTSVPLVLKSADNSLNSGNKEQVFDNRTHNSRNSISINSSCNSVKSINLSQESNSSQPGIRKVKRFKREHITLTLSNSNSRMTEVRFVYNDDNDPEKGVSTKQSEALITIASKVDLECIDNVQCNRDISIQNREPSLQENVTKSMCSQKDKPGPATVRTPTILNVRKRILGTPETCLLPVRKFRRLNPVNHVLSGVQNVFAPHTEQESESRYESDPVLPSTTDRSTTADKPSDNISALGSSPLPRLDNRYESTTEKVHESSNNSTAELLNSVSPRIIKIKKRSRRNVFSNS